MGFVINLAFCDFLYCSIALPIYALQYFLQRPILGRSMCIGTSIVRNIVIYADWMTVGKKRY